ncbi:MAG: hypothetical protein U1G07_14490 [Verrucomicrobiota bacterium]
MNRPQLLQSAFAFVVLCCPLQGAVRTSSSYQITIEAIDAGGGTATGGPYSMVSSLGGVGGLAGNTAHSIENNSGYVGQLPSSVVGRWVFYNDSAWDGNNPAANSQDDQAIAPDKSALLNGSQATFANYTSYSKGINGLIMDVTELSGVPTASDFVFKTGKAGEPGTWPSAPPPASISVRWGAGTNGSDRLTLTWPAHQIEGAWLQIRAKAGENFGLGTDDVFYFGNAVGETGDAAGKAEVLVQDALRVMNHLSANAGIENPYDFDRDKKALVQDALLAMNHLTAGAAALQLINTSSSANGLLGRPLATADGRPTTTLSRTIAGKLSVASPVPINTGFFRPSRIVACTIESLEGGRARLWLWPDSPRLFTVWTAKSLAATEWHPVPAEAVRTHAAGVLEVELPVDPSGQTGFFRLAEAHP